MRSERIERAILLMRGQRVMLDADLAELYGVETKALNRAVQRNRTRFPADFMFRLTGKESEHLRYQIGTSSLRSQIATSRTGHGGRRYFPYAFTEQGVAMLSSVLRSERAVRVKHRDHAGLCKAARAAGNAQRPGPKAGGAGAEVRYAVQGRLRRDPPADDATGAADDADRVSRMKTARYFEEQVLHKGWKGNPEAGSEQSAVRFRASVSGGA